MVRLYERKPMPRYLGMSFVFGHFLLVFLSKFELFGLIFPVTMMINVAGCFNVSTFLGRYHHGKLVSQLIVDQILNNAISKEILILALCLF